MPEGERATTNGRLLAKVLREVLAAGPYDTLGDAAHALKVRAARYRIAATDDDITAACRLVGSNRALVHPAGQQRRRRRPYSELDEVAAPSAVDARTILARIFEHLDNDGGRR